MDLKFSLTRITIDSLALLVALAVVPGFHLPDHSLSALIIVVVFLLLNAALRPLFWLLTFPLVLFTVFPLLFGMNIIVLLLTVEFSTRAGLVIQSDGPISILLAVVLIIPLRAMGYSLVGYLERKRLLRMEKKWVRQLQQYKTELEQERDYWQARYREKERQLSAQIYHPVKQSGNFVSSLVQPDPSSWVESYRADPRLRFRAFYQLYRWHEPFYHWYTRRGRDSLLPIRKLVKKVWLNR